MCEMASMIDRGRGQQHKHTPDFNAVSCSELMRLIMKITVTAITTEPLYTTSTYLLTYLLFTEQCVAVFTAAFIGCVRNVRIQTFEVNPVKVVHSPLGVGLSLGDCELVDWCRPDGTRGETVCQHGGRCSSSWHQADCHCTDDYTGQFCETC